MQRNELIAVAILGSIGFAMGFLMFMSDENIHAVFGWFQ